MLGPCHIIRTATMQITIRVGLLVQRVGIPPPQHLRDHPLVLRFGSVSIPHAVRLLPLRCFIHPGFKWSGHSDLPAGAAFRLHIVQSAAPRSLAAPTTLRMTTPDQVGALKRMDSALPAGPSKGGIFRPGWQAFCCYPPTVYVTPRRPCKPPPAVPPPSRRQLSLPFLFTSLLLSCCKLVSLVSPIRSRPLAHRTCQSPQSPQHRRRRPGDEQLRLPPSSCGESLCAGFSRSALRSRRRAAARSRRGVQDPRRSRRGLHSRRRNHRRRPPSIAAHRPAPRASPPLIRKRLAASPAA